MSASAIAPDADRPPPSAAQDTEDGTMASSSAARSSCTASALQASPPSPSPVLAPPPSLPSPSPKPPRRRTLCRPKVVRVLLGITFPLLVSILVYVNIRAMTRRDVTSGNQFLSRILEDSVSSIGGRTTTAATATGGGSSVGGSKSRLIGEGGVQSKSAASDSDEEKVSKLRSKLSAMEREFQKMKKRMASLRNKSYGGIRSGGGGGNGKNAATDQKGADLKKGETAEERTSRRRAQRIRQQQKKDERRSTRQSHSAPKENETQTADNNNNNKNDSKKKPMNILFFYADDWRHDTLSSAGNKVLRTPVLDALAEDGIRFTHNCVTTSVCWISRATLYTGQYMSRHKTQSPCCWNGTAKPKKPYKEAPQNWKDLSFYELLKQKKGYHVGHAGKWGVYLPFPKTLDFNIEEDGWHYRKIGPKTWHITEKNEADALRFLFTRPRDKPFFLNVAFYATHAKDGDKRQYMPQNASMELYADETVPLPATATDDAWKRMPYFFKPSRGRTKNEGRTRWTWRYDNETKRQIMMKNYYRMATEVDSAVGQIMDELRRQGELDNTLIIFTTDNGNFHAEHGLADKWYPHQESIRVPLVIRDPRMDPSLRGTLNDEFTLNIDLAPTLLAAAGVDKPEMMMGRDIAELYLPRQRQGEDQQQREEEEQSEQSTLKAEESRPQPSTKDNSGTQWRTEFFYEHPIISHKDYIPASEALVRKEFKFMYWPNWKYGQFFDLRNDPGEMEDLMNSTDPEIVKVRGEMIVRFRYLKDLVKSDKVVTL